MGEALREAGFEAIYTDPPDPKGPIGLNFPSEDALDAALKVNADAICVFTVVYVDSAILEILELMKKKGMKDVLLFGGGLITPEDAEGLSKQGAGWIFGVGTPLRDVVKYLIEEIPRRRPARP